MKKSDGSMRGQMPRCAEFIDSLRATFGTEEINKQIKRGMAGVPNCFHAVEGGAEIGTPFDGVCVQPELAHLPERGNAGR